MLRRRRTVVHGGRPGFSGGPAAGGGGPVAAGGGPVVVAATNHHNYKIHNKYNIKYFFLSKRDAAGKPTTIL